MEKILEEKKINKKDIFTQDCNNKDKQFSEIQNKQIMGLRKKNNKDFIMDRRKQYSRNYKNITLIIKEEISSKIIEDIKNSPMVYF